MARSRTTKHNQLSGYHTIRRTTWFKKRILGELPTVRADGTNVGNAYGRIVESSQRLMAGPRPNAAIPAKSGLTISSCWGQNSVSHHFSAPLLLPGGWTHHLLIAVHLVDALLDTLVAQHPAFPPAPHYASRTFQQSSRRFAEEYDPSSRSHPPSRVHCTDSHQMVGDIHHPAPSERHHRSPTVFLRSRLAHLPHHDRTRQSHLHQSTRIMHLLSRSPATLLVSSPCSTIAPLKVSMF